METQKNVHLLNISEMSIQNLKQNNGTSLTVKQQVLIQKMNQ